jgi:beta-glucosidase-like glycosyl hydrolase
VPRLGVPSYHYGYEALHGMINGCPFADRCFTSFPCASASAAAFNRTLWWSVGKAQIDEMRGMYNTQHELTFGQKNHLVGLHIRGPQLNPQREPRWGRNDNSPGEDAYLEGQYGAMMVLGGQGGLPDGTYPFGDKRKALCEMKHFDAYSVEDGRNGKTDTFDISLKDLASYYFVPLRACVEIADVGAFMCSYNALNGTAACGNRWLNVEVARNTWNFSGVIESDCGAISGIQAHGNADSVAEAAIAAVRATVDVECDSAYSSTLLNSTNAGLVHRSSLENAAARVLKGRFQIGQFDPAAAGANTTTLPWDDLTDDDVFSESHQALSLEAAEQSAVLLRNPPAGAGVAHLPLHRGMHLAVIGPNGNVADVFQGQYHGSNCPGRPEAWNGSYDCLPTAYTAIRDANAGGKTTYHAGCALSPSASDGSGHPEGQPCTTLDDNMTGVLAAASEADVVLLFLGLDIKMTNKEGQDRAHNETGYALPGMQQALAKEIADKTETPVVVVVLSGMATGMDYIASQKNWPLLIGGYGGRYGPVALAKILFGDVSPTGRLPYTIYPELWAAHTDVRDMSLTGGDGRTYAWYHGKEKLPFAFGEGMTYTEFSVAVEVAAEDGAGAETTTMFAVRVTNTGSTAAQHTIMLFARRLPSSKAALDADLPWPLPNRQLFDFGRTTTMEPGDIQTITFAVRDRDVALADWDGSIKSYAGHYAIEFFDGGKVSVASMNYEVKETTIWSTLPAPPKP